MCSHKSQLSQQIIWVPSSGRSHSGQIYNSGPPLLVSEPTGALVFTLRLLLLLLLLLLVLRVTVFLGILSIGGGDGVCTIPFGNLIEGTIFGTDEVISLKRWIVCNYGILLYTVVLIQVKKCFNHFGACPSGLYREVVLIKGGLYIDMFHYIIVHVHVH